MITIEFTDLDRARACVQWMISNMGAITSKPYEFVSGPGWRTETRCIPSGDIIIKVTADLDNDSPRATEFVLQFA